ncbi:MAG: bifunctional glutamate N-acetyltransferase/amino-acid acetyltransferase ArgJ [bacterium]
MSTGGGLSHPVVVAPRESRFLALPEAARLVEPDDGSAGVTYPAGFLASGVAAGLKASGRPDVGVVAVAPEWRAEAVSAAVFTTNAFAAAPVVLTRTECDLSRLVAVAINSGNANACTGDAGLLVARAMQAASAEVLGVAASAVAVASTGVIGVQLDAALVAAAVSRAAAATTAGGGGDFSNSIMTTDRFPKMCAFEMDAAGGAVRLGVCAKGAGMISPAMATMLCVASTDAVLTADEMSHMLGRAVSRSFNLVTVDGEQSTNDSVFFLASGASGVRPEGSDLVRFGHLLDAMLLRTALMMVADGEGATKIMRLSVLGAETNEDAEAVARAIADSPLVKTAMHGGDANWGRIISSAGAALAGRDLPKARLELCGVTVVDGGAACAVSEADRVQMRAAMQQPEIEIRLDLGSGVGSSVVFFADMGHEYININAEYHS